MQKYKFLYTVQNPLINFFLFILLILGQSFDTKAQNDIAKKADSLFNAKNYTEATKLYEAIFGDEKVNNQIIALKLAYIYENKGDYPKTQYYLNSSYNLNPKDDVFDKMNKIAILNKYSGYERNNINFVFTLYQQYYIFILYAFIILGFFLVWLVWNKKRNKRKILPKNWIAVFLYLIALAVLINLPTGYKSAIVKEKTYLREFPSSAAPIIGEIEPGNKINIFGSQDIWEKAYWEKRVVYVNRYDLWLLKN